MKSFQFRLESVLRLRDSQLKQAEETLRKAAARRDVIHMELQAMASENETLRRTICCSPTLLGSDLQWAASYAASLAFHRRRLSEQLKKAVEELAKTRDEYLLAKTRTDLLCRLRAKRLAEWKTAEALHWEAVASESFLAVRHN